MGFPKDHLLRRMNVFVTGVLADLHQQLEAFLQRHRPPFDRSGIDDPDAHCRILLRHPLERRLCQEVELHLAYRWFCKLDLDDKVPHHSTFSDNRLERFRESDILRHVFERVVAAAWRWPRQGRGFRG